MTNPSNPVLWLDFETFSEKDLKKCGADVYARHHTTEVLMLGWAIDNEDPRLWDTLNAPFNMPSELVPFLINRTGTIRAHNAPFEIAILGKTIGVNINLDNWQCSQVMAYSLSFAGSLGTILKAIGFPEDTLKDERGPKLINKFCKLAPENHKATRYDKANSPDDWADFEDYCLQDVHILREMWNWCEHYSPVSELEWDRWRRDRVINQRGLPIDLALVTASLAAMGYAKVELKKRIRDLTGKQEPAKITNGPLKAWLHSNGCLIENLQKATKEKAVLTESDPTVKAVLEAHLLLAQTSSSSKWNALKERGIEGSEPGSYLIRETIQFVGAGRTGRAAGRGLQLQNLKRSPDDMEANINQILAGDRVTMEQISTSIRGAIKAPDGQLLVVSDLSSIESRVAGWLTGCTRIINTFADGKDTYKDLATELFHVPYDQVTKDQRGFAKPAALGCQYMLGARGLVAYAENYGVAMNEQEARSQVTSYRAIYPELPAFWRWIKDALFYVIQYQINKLEPVKGYHLSIYIEGQFLFIELPSGRRLNYFKPDRIMGPAPWDKSVDIPKFKFEGMDNYKWGAITARAGGILENIVQAISRDILYEWLDRAEAAGHVILGSVHDEVISIAAAGQAENNLASLNALAAEPIAWAPGLQLAAAGYCSPYYKKD